MVLVELMSTDTTEEIKLPKLDFRIVSTQISLRRLAWRFMLDPDSSEELPDIKGFNLFYSETPTQRSAWCLLNQDGLLLESKFDHCLVNFSKFTRGYYWLETVLNTGEKIISKKFDGYMPEDPYVNEMYVDNVFDVMAFPEYGSGHIPCFIYPRRYSGDQCKCRSSSRQGVAVDKCQECFGVGYKGGYFPPVLAFLDYDTTSNRYSRQENIRTTQDTQMVARTSCYFTIVNPEDVIREIFPPHRLWHVKDMPQVYEYNLRPISQSMTLKLVDSGHPIYEIPTPVVDLPQDVWRTFRDPDTQEFKTVLDIYDETAKTVRPENEEDWYRFYGRSPF